jgi:hypothetical protein
MPALRGVAPYQQAGVGGSTPISPPGAEQVSGESGDWRRSDYE